jgi:hypothetical protein
MKAVWRVAVAALAVASLAGCADIPTTGTVGSGVTIAQNAQDFTLDYIPQGPTAGATPGEILRGFIEAASSPRDDYAVARKYLTTGLQRSWNADDSVTIEGGQDYRRMSENGWELSVTPVAQVDSTGAYHEADSKKPVLLQYRLVKDHGQWRISQAPNGVVLDMPTFDTVFTARPLYFFSPDFAFAVPDLRWFPARVSTPTRIVRALLAGPSKWLSGGGVVTAFPQGTKLAVDAVPTNNGRAAVNLNDAAGGADRLSLERMKYQLQRSLLDGVTVGSVQVLINGRIQPDIPDLGAASLPISDPQVDPRPMIEKHGAFGFSNGEGVAQIPGLSHAVSALGPRAVCVSADQHSAAVLTGDGVYFVRDAGDAMRVDTRRGLLAPTLDPRGYVWSVPENAPGHITVTSTQGKTEGKHTSVRAAWTGVSTIRSLQVSRDGTRALAVLGVGSRTLLVVAAVIRDKSGVPTSLGQPLTLTTGPGAVLSATWVDELTVASLSEVAGSGKIKASTEVTTQVIGGQSQSEAGPAQARTIVGGAAPALWVRTANGSLQTVSGTGWQERATGVQVLAIQQGAPR